MAPGVKNPTTSLNVLLVLVLCIDLTSLWSLLRIQKPRMVMVSPLGLLSVPLSRAVVGLVALPLTVSVGLLSGIIKSEVVAKSSSSHSSMSIIGRS